MVMSSIAAARAFRVTCHRQPSSLRAFHSPFVALKATESPLTSAPAPSATLSPISAPLSSYEKQEDHYTSEPHISSSGTRMYVVSEPDPLNTAYEVPYGAYPTTAPYANYPLADGPPNPEGKHSSTSSTLPHPHTTSAHAVPQNKSGIGESAALRNAEAPGEMGRRGGSYGGLGLMDEKTTTRRTRGIEFGEKKNEQSFRTLKENK